MVAIQTGVIWNLKLFSICKTVMAEDNRTLWKYLLDICVSSFERCQSSLQKLDLIGSLNSFVFNFCSSLCIFHINTFTEVKLAKGFFHVCIFVGRFFAGPDGFIAGL